MKYSAIAPIANLNETKGNAIHMALTHLCKIPEYAEFMRSEHEEGKFIMLDNSLIELGRAVTTEELLEAAELVCADEIIIPDSYKNAKETVERATKAMKEIKKSGYKNCVMAVAHGKTLDEWAWCAKQLIALNIDTLGIPKVMCEVLGRQGRMMCIRKLKRMFMSGEIKYIPTLHLLGIWDDALEVGEIERRGELKVRSVDSVLAYKFASFGMHFEDGPRPAGGVKFETAAIAGAAGLKILQDNITELRQLCIDDMDLLPEQHFYSILSLDPNQTKRASITHKGNISMVDFGEVKNDL